MSFSGSMTRTAENSRRGGAFANNFDSFLECVRELWAISAILMQSVLR